MRLIGFFWAALIGLLVIGAVVLQVLGPVHRGVSAATPEAVRPPPHAVQSPVPSSDKPAPPPLLGLTAQAIPDPDPALLEPAPDFPDQKLPMLAADGRTAYGTYAAYTDPAERHPRVALVLDGVGLDGALSAKANESLPSAVDFAISAYAPAPQSRQLAAAGRKHGRECLVSIPMEPAGAPAADEGIWALLTGATQEANRLNLERALSGVQGCVGATGASDGMAGERYATSAQAMADLLQEVDQRGLIYFDPRPSAVPPIQLAPLIKRPRIADIVLDQAPSPGEPATAEMIDARLAQLEQIAAERGSAIGVMGPPRPVLLERIAVWANGLAARGLVLSPLTALPQPASGSAVEPSGRSPSEPAGDLAMPPAELPAVQPPG